MKKIKIILVAGARPNFMKIAPLEKEIRKYPRFKPVIVNTEQHYDYKMSEVFFRELSIPKPDVYLGVGSGNHGEQTGKVMIEFEKVCIKEKPDLVIVVGDVNSTIGAALAAAKLFIPLAHIEAGLRSYDHTMPEEINRLLTDHISDYLFTTSEYDDENLVKENISKEKIFCVGNIMADSLISYKKLAARRKILSELEIKKENYALLTLHRPSNVDNKQKLLSIFNALKEISNRIKIVFPAHPRTQKNISDFGLEKYLKNSAIRLIPPLGYMDCLNLEMNSKFVITDSGGIEVETTMLGIPCLTILDSPVWTITHTQGTNIFVGSDRGKLINSAFQLIDGKPIKNKCPELWDGKTSKRIVKILNKKL